MLGPKIAWADMVNGNPERFQKCIEARKPLTCDHVQNYIHFNYEARSIVAIHDSDGAMLADLTGMTHQEEMDAAVEKCLASNEQVFFQLEGFQYSQLIYVLQDSDGHFISPVLREDFVRFKRFSVSLFNSTYY